MVNENTTHITFENGFIWTQSSFFLDSISWIPLNATHSAFETTRACVMGTYRFTRPYITTALINCNLICTSETPGWPRASDTCTTHTGSKSKVEKYFDFVQIGKKKKKSENIKQYIQHTQVLTALCTSQMTVRQHVLLSFTGRNSPAELLKWIRIWFRTWTK